jgi:hypothetical protein
MKNKLRTLLLLSLVLLLSACTCEPPKPKSQLVGLWRFSTIPYTVEFRSDSSFIQEQIVNKDQKRNIWNRGSYVVDYTKNPASIDIYGLSGRTFGQLGAGDGSYKGSIRFPTADVAEIIYTPCGPGYNSFPRPTSFDKDYKIILQRIKPQSFHR